VTARRASNWQRNLQHHSMGAVFHHACWAAPNSAHWSEVRLWWSQAVSPAAQRQQHEGQFSTTYLQSPFMNLLATRHAEAGFRGGDCLFVPAAPAKPDRPAHTAGCPARVRLSSPRNMSACLSHDAREILRSDLNGRNWGLLGCSRARSFVDRLPRGTSHASLSQARRVLAQQANLSQAWTLSTPGQR
jgi:hypothetical protein